MSGNGVTMIRERREDSPRNKKEWLRWRWWNQNGVVLEEEEEVHLLRRREAAPATGSEAAAREQERAGVRVMSPHSVAEKCRWDYNIKKWSIRTSSFSIFPPNFPPFT